MSAVQDHVGQALPYPGIGRVVAVDVRPVAVCRWDLGQNRFGVAVDHELPDLRELAGQVPSQGYVIASCLPGVETGSSIQMADEYRRARAVIQWC